MNNVCTVQNTTPYWGPRKYHQYQVFVPQTCQAESLKVTNLRNQIKELESHLVEINKMESKMEFLSTGKLVAAFTAETCIGFLDLAASILSAVPGGKAAETVAKNGMASIKFTKDMGEFRTGKIDTTQLVYRTTQNVKSVTPAETLGSKTLLNTSGTALNAFGVAVGEMEGSEFAYKAGLSNAQMMSDAVEETLGEKAKTVRVLKGLFAFEGVVSAAKSYQDSLDKIFDERLDEIDKNRQWAITARANTRNLISALKEKLTLAIDDLNRCVNESSQPPFSPAF